MTRPLPPRRRARSGATAGFTLIEILVSLAVAGVIGTSIYFVYRSQARIVAAQESVAQSQAELRFAMETIKADVKRAGYLAALNTATDSFWCGPRPSPALTALLVQPGYGYVHNAAENVNITPDSLRILGSFNANNTLYSQSVAGTTITLSNDPSYSPGFPASQADFERIFASGTLLRILDTSNRYQIQRISSSSFASRTLTLEALNRSTVQGCGPMGLGQGLLVNPLEYVRYRIVDTSNSSNPGACADSPMLVGRTTLVRENLAPDGTTVLATTQLADYVVDFRTWFMIDTAALGAQPSIADDTNPYDFVGNAAAATVNASPQQVRTVGLFLAIRTPAEDPSFVFRQRATTANGVGPLISFNLDANRNGACRVRTLATEVMLRNFALSSRL